MYPNRRQSNSSQLGIIILIIALIIVLAIYANHSKAGNKTLLVSSSTQQEALQRLANESGESVRYVEKNGVIRHLSFAWSNAAQHNSQLLVDDFINTYADIFGIGDPEAQLQLVDQYQDASGVHTFSYEQIYQGVTVYGSGLAFHVSSEGVLDWYEGGYLPNLAVDTTPRITAEQALEMIQNQLAGEEMLVLEEPSLTIYDVGVIGENDSISPRLAWVQLIVTDSIYATYLVDAHSGVIIDSIPILEDIQYEIYDEDERSLRSLFLDPGEVVYDQDGKKKIGILIDPEAERLSDQIQSVYDFYSNNFNWRSYDGKDSYLEMHINVIFEKGPNACWDQFSKAMYFSNNYVGESVDVLAHEFTHGVTNALVGFKHYRYTVSESAALAESLSDVFTAFMDPEHPWQICMNDCAVGGFERFDLIRDLQDPGVNGYPSHYSQLVKPGDELCRGDEDSGCEHANSTIHSHAVYLFTQQIGMTKSSQILFRALQSDMLVNTPNFAMARRVVEGTCQDMIGEYGINAQDCEYISEAYDAVGIGEPLTAVDPSRQTYFVTPTSPVIQTSLQSQNSETVLVMDISGSMGELDAGGVEKMLGAQRAASDLINVIISEQDAAGETLVHQVGLVAFSDGSDTINSLTEDIDILQDELWQLDPDGGTAMAAGLEDAIAQFETDGDAQRMIILLSDGLPNIGLDFLSNFFGTQDEETIQQEILDLASQAGEANICVHTIGFGNPQADSGDEAYIDEDFLRRVAQASGCGQYYSAQESSQLANAFVELRHETMGTLVMQESGTIAQNETLNLGSVNLSSSYEQLVFTLNWPGSYLLTVLTDPQGRLVDADYPGATLNEQDTVTTIIIDRPSSGNWNVTVYGQDVPEGMTSYNALMSTRGLIEEESNISVWVWAGAIIVAVVGIGFVTSSHSHTKTQDSSSRQQITPGWTRSAYLQVVNGEQAGKNYRLDEQTLVGRGSHCQVSLRDLSVSRTHAVLFFTDGHWFIQDQGSKAGTRLNGKRIDSAQMRSGDRIKLGHTELIFIWE